MARSSTVHVQVVGLKELQRDLKAASDKFPRELRGVNKKAAEVVVPTARSNAPRRTGRLAASVKAQASTRSAYVKAGTASRVPYAGVIHFGWPGHNIEPQPFLYDAVEQEGEQIVEEYAELLDDVLRRIF